MVQKELLTNEQLRLAVEAKWIEHIKLCQDNFLYFVKEVWPDFICRLDPNPKRWGHHQHIASEFTKISTKKKGGSLSICPLDILNQNLHHTCFLPG